MTQHNELSACTAALISYLTGRTFGNQSRLTGNSFLRPRLDT
jgi:hypothetical protein